MQTHTVQHASRDNIDDILLDRLRPLSLPVDNQAGTIRIGIEGPAGTLYRVIETSSLVEAVRVFETLTDLGLVPRRRGRVASELPMRVFHRP